MSERDYRFNHATESFHADPIKVNPEGRPPSTPPELLNHPSYKGEIMVDETQKQEWDFTYEPDGTIGMRDAVMQAMGGASMCWVIDGHGIFDVDKATHIGEKLLEVIEKNQLGNATTRDLMKELEVRMSTTQNSIKGRELSRLCEEGQKKLDIGVLSYRRIN